MGSAVELLEFFNAYCCELSRRVLRAHLRWRVTNASNDNSVGGFAA